MTIPDDPRYHRIRPTIPKPLPEDVSDIAAEDIYLAGLVPFTQDDAGSYRFYVTRPTARKPDLPPPLYQLAKGTRMGMDSPPSWRDLTAEDLPIRMIAEELHITALREAEEEIGLRPEAITAPLWYFGIHRFFSATTREPKHMALFFTHIPESHVFAAPDSTYGKTSDSRWLSLAESPNLMRPNHAKALERFVAWMEKTTRWHSVETASFHLPSAAQKD